jgi:hypothetical protein
VPLPVGAKVRSPTVTGPPKVTVPAAPVPDPKTASLPFAHVWLSRLKVAFSQFCNPAVHVPAPSWLPEVSASASQTRVSARTGEKEARPSAVNKTAMPPVKPRVGKHVHG